MGSSAIFSSGYAKILAANGIKLKDDTLILHGSIDPIVSNPTAPNGSLYLSSQYGLHHRIGSVWVKLLDNETDKIFSLQNLEGVASWSIGNSATFLASGTLSGTLSNETSTPLNGAQSYKYTQASGSLNDWFVSQAKSVPLKFRGQRVFLSFPYQYNGSASDILCVIYDSTNSQIITTSQDFVTGTNGATSNLLISAVIPLTCTSIRIGFHVKVANSGKIFLFDDLELSLNAFSQILTSETEYINTIQSASTLLDAAGELRFANTISSTNRGIIRIDDDSANSRTKFTAVRSCTINAYFGASLSGTNSIVFIRLNGAQLNIGSHVRVSGDNSVTSIPIVMNTGDFLTFEAVPSVPVGQSAYLYITATAQVGSISVPTQQVSSDTMLFSFKSTAITDSDPVGTFNTYTYAANTNTPTIAGAAPTQTTSSMNTNGIQVFGRAYNAASTTLQPARVDIKIGKGLKSKQVDAYLSTGKSGRAHFDYYLNGTSSYGCRVGYDELTGILTINGAIQPASIAANDIVYSDTNAGQSSGYFVFNASTTPSIAAIPSLQPRIAYLSDVKASGTSGGTSSAGAYQTRVLNTIVDSFGIVSSLSSNQFTLPAGTYKISAIAPAYRVNKHRIKIRNVTDSTNAIFGQLSRLDSTSGAGGTCQLEGEVTITSSKTFELQHFTQDSLVTEGLGIAVVIGGEVEVYSQVTITKIR